MPTDFMGRVMVVFQRYGMSMLQGAGVSIRIALVGTIVGCIIGFAVGIVQTIPVEAKDNPIKKAVLWVIKLIMNAYVEFFRGTPMMVQAMFIYYGSAYLFNINMSMWFAAFFVVSINTGAYMAETVRGGILSVDEGQTEAARSLGMSASHCMTKIILPQAVKAILPSLAGEYISMIKETSLAGTFMMYELMYTRVLLANKFLTWQPLFIISGMYLVMTTVLTWLSGLLEKRLAESD